jgi:hypothetical protein
MSDESTSAGASRLSDLALDGAAIGGAGLITIGAHMIYQPAAFIVGGLFLLGGAWLTARRAA